MLRPFETEVCGETLQLFPEKAMYWKNKDVLIIADLHLGKANHFRRAGIPVPEATNTANLENFIDLMKFISPGRVIFLGDLFHSVYNEEWEALGQVLSHFPATNFELVEGNHDVMSPYQYAKHGIKVLKDPMIIHPFIFSHEPLESGQSAYNIAGHVHPSVRLSGKARQGMRLPCYYFGEQNGLLPAFGAFTGTFRLKPTKKDKVYVIANNTVMDVSYEG